MKLVQIFSLVDKPIAGVRADIRSRLPDGSLRYPHEQEAEILVTMKRVAITMAGRCCADPHVKAKDRVPWLHWYWDGYSCGYAGIRLDADEAKQVHLLMDL